MSRQSSLFVKYKIVAFVSLLVLFITQCYLTYHTFEWKDHDYFGVIKPIVGNKYLSELKGDILYPGGDEVLEEYIIRNYPTIERLYISDSTQFVKYSNAALDTLFADLRRKSSLDSFMDGIFKEQGLKENLEYKVAVHDFGVLISGKEISLFNKNSHGQFTNPESKVFYYGAQIGGSLEKCTQANRFTTIAVDRLGESKYYIRFSLWVDSPDRIRTIITSMLPILFLSLISITIMVFLFFTTFKNWARQKKLADLKQDFVNNITHELNTPLTTIIVANGNLKNKEVLKDSSQISALTGIIERNSFRLRGLFTKVLQSEAIGNTSLNKQGYLLYPLLSELIGDYKLTLGSSSNVTISLSVFGEERAVLIDKFWFTSLIYNLFDNGIKYNTNRQKEIKVSVFYERNQVILKIVDNGMGMSERVKQRIFEKFYRNKASETKNTTGLGLGLYYVKQCTTAHGWDIEVESQEGDGTSFIINMGI